MICKAPADRCGIFYLPPPLPGRTDRPASLPLVGTSVGCEVQDLYATTTVEQVYRNDTAADVARAVYSFPLHNRAAVCKFETETDGVVSHGKVLEKQQARQDFDAAVSSGGSAQLVEQESRDVFQMCIGGLKAGATVTVRLTHVAVLRVVGDAVELFVPTHVAPRYKGPAVAGAAAAATTSLALQVTCRMASDITSIASQTHGISTAIGVDGSGARGSFNLTAGTSALDKDFVALITTAEPHQPRVAVEKSTLDGSYTAAVTLAPKLEFEDCKAEFVFVVDRSGSMSGAGITQARSALTLFLRSLPHDCYFNIIGFGSRFETLFPGGSIKLSSSTLATATEHVSRLQANLGGTEILSPVLAALGAPPIKGYARQVFVLTDGQVGNTDEVCAAVGRERSARCFALGFGHGASRGLVEGIAKAGRGSSAFVVGDELDRAVVAQLKRAMQPSLTDIGLDWMGGVAAPPLSAEEAAKPAQGLGSLLSYTTPAVAAAKTRPTALQAPHTVPPIFSEERFALFVLDADPALEAVTITAATPDGPLSVTLPVTMQTEGTMLQTLAGREAIADLEGGTSWLHRDGRTPGPNEVKAEVVKLGSALGLVSKHTSYLATQPPLSEPERHSSRRSRKKCLARASTGGRAPRGGANGGGRGRAAGRSASFASPSGGGLEALARSAPPPPMCASDSLYSAPASCPPMRAQYGRSAPPPPPCVQEDWKCDDWDDCDDGGAPPPPPPMPASAPPPPPMPASAPPPPPGRLASVLCPPPPMMCNEDAQRYKTKAKKSKKSTHTFANMKQGRATNGGSMQRQQQQQQGARGAASGASGAAPADPLQRLILLQEFDGAFTLAAPLAAAVGQQLAGLEAAAAAAGIDPAVFGAMVAVAYLRTKLADRQSEWELVAQKTLKWLSRQQQHPQQQQQQHTPLNAAEALFASG